jgi:hypothetical protein
MMSRVATIVCSLQVDWIVVCFVLILVVNDNLLECNVLSTEMAWIRTDAIVRKEDVTIIRHRVFSEDHLGL